MGDPVEATVGAFIVLVPNTELDEVPVLTGVVNDAGVLPPKLKEPAVRAGKERPLLLTG